MKEEKKRKESGGEKKRIGGRREKNRGKREKNRGRTLNVSLINSP